MDITFMVLTTTERDPPMLRLRLTQKHFMDIMVTLTVWATTSAMLVMDTPLPLCLRWNCRHQRCPGTRRGLHCRGCHPLLQRWSLHQLPRCRRPLLDRQSALTVATSSFVNFIELLIKTKI